MMKSIFTVILCFLVLWAVQPARAGEKINQGNSKQSTHAANRNKGISKDELAAARMMEMLAMMDMLKHLDLMEDYEIVEENKDEKNN